MALVSRAWILASFVGPHVSAGSSCLGGSTCNLAPFMDSREPPLRDQALLQTKLSTHAGITSHKTIHEELNVNYAGEDGADEHNLDIQWPSDAAPAGGWPAVIALHGNGQTKGSMYYYCRKRVKSGRLCMAPNRGASQFTDSKLAVEWFFANAAAYGVNINKVVLYGYSMGGYLTHRLIWEARDIGEKVTAAIIASGTSPTYVDMASAGGPPMLLISCENDGVVKYKHTLSLYDKLSELGSDVTMWTCHDGHGSQKAEGFDEQVDAFLDRVAPVSGVLAESTTISTPITSKCQDWCANHDVTTACKWDTCNGCAGC